MNQKLTQSLLTLILLAAIMATSAFAAPPADKTNIDAPVLNELLVLFDNGTSPDAVVDEVNINTPSTGLVNRLGSPQSARLLISDRLSLAARDKLGPDNPEVLLQQYTMMKYPETMSPVAFNNVKEMLIKNPDVLWVQENIYLQWSATPNDPLFPAQSQASLPEEYQWGMHRLNLPAAWDFVKGNAYISVLDNGIMLDHDDLDSTVTPPLNKNFREQFSYDFNHNIIDTTNVDELKQYNPDDHLASAGHGTHVAGIIAASTDNKNAQGQYDGVAGVCWHCNLMIGKVSSYSLPVEDAIIDGINGMSGGGTQAINMSFGLVNADYSPLIDCGITPFDAFCLAIESAKTKDVVIVSASGNYNKPLLQFPASDFRVISVGAVDNADQRFNHSTNEGSNYGSRLDIVAPGVDILSTFYKDRTWNALQPWNCADSISGPSGYGPCTGTSMAAPHITGLVGLLRSANPLLSRDATKDILTSSSVKPVISDPNNEYGAGIPDAAMAVKKALGTVSGIQLKNRLTPLFSFYSAALTNHFYTTVPQMANAALTGFLRPHPAGSFLYSSIGTITPGYANFPGRSCTFSPCSDSPKASVYVFTTENPPFTGAPNLVPLYRLSYLGVNHVDHTYTTTPAGIDAFVGVGYNLDGIEGYIYPRETTPQPTGTVKLYRKYNYSRDDHAIFPESELSAMTAAGYTENDGDEWIGYVYPNIDSDGDGLINGFETLIGTCVNTADTNSDGTNDGNSVLVYSNSTHSYKEPGQCLPLLTVNKAGTGTGTVSSNPSGINCGTDCTNSYSLGTSVTLTVSGLNGSTFSGWSGGGCSGTGSCTVIMNATTTVTASFAAPQQYTLTVTKSGTGSGTVTSSPGGISCGSDCNESYNAGTYVTLTATPNPGSTFSNWNGGMCFGTGSCTVRMNSATTVTASFAVLPKYTLTMTKSGTGSGTVTSSPGGISCGPDCTEPYNAGTYVTLTATPNAGSGFSGWSGGGCSGKGTCTVLMNSAYTVNATFIRTKFEENDPAITYSGSWNTYACFSCSGGSMKYAGTSGASASISFNGTGIKLIMTKNNNLGIAGIYLDGVYSGAIDQYSPTVQYQFATQNASLAAGNHTVAIKVSGQKNGSSTGYNVTLDAAEITP